jgi:hypothetical protein
MVAHACDPSYSGGRDQENHGSKLALAKSSWDPPPTSQPLKAGHGGTCLSSQIHGLNW